MMRIAIRRSARGALDSKSKAETSTEETDAKDVEKPPPPPEDPCPSACPICQESVGEPTADGITETWASLPCGHAFGSGCIKTWLAITEHPTCPICRLPMAHSCRHPVLPVLEPPPNRFSSNTALMRTTGPKLLPSSTSPASSSSLLSSRSPYHYYLMPRSAATTIATPSSEKWRWQGRKLSGQCGFCASVRSTPPLPIRLAAAALKLALSRSRRGRRIVAMQPSMYYGESEDDQWRVAFRAWWSQQEPRLGVPLAAQGLEAAPAQAQGQAVAQAQAQAVAQAQAQAGAANSAASGRDPEQHTAPTAAVAVPVTVTLAPYC